MDWRNIKSYEDLEKIYPKHILDKFPIPDRGYYKNVPDSDWYNWKWQLQNRITTLEELEKIITVTPEERRSFSECAKKFKMAITPYYASLMDRYDPKCPIRKECVPYFEEMNILATDMEDPLAEDRDSPVPGLTHRYPDRVLFYVSHDCPLLCRHCTRKRKVSKPDSAAQGELLERGIDYIRNHPEVRDIVVSGGDPCCLGSDKIGYVLSRLREIPHVEVVRLGTRTPVTLPMRWREDSLLEQIEKVGPIHLNTHFNHPRAMTRENLLAVTRIHLAGVAMGNQSVLLKGVNDDAKIMMEVCHKLLLMKIRPYYIYQCDLAEGINHFRTKVSKGVEIIRAMRGWTSGLAIPQFVVDAPGGGGKIPINPNYIESYEGNKLVLKNYKGMICSYYEPEEK